MEQEQMENGAAIEARPTLADMVAEFQELETRLLEFAQLEARRAHLRAAIMELLGFSWRSEAGRKGSALRKRHGVAAPVDPSTLRLTGVSYNCRKVKHRQCHGWGYPPGDKTRRFRCTCSCH